MNDGLAKWRSHGRAILKVKLKLDRMHDVVLYATEYSYGYSVGSTLVERLSTFSMVSTGHDGKKVVLLLLESNYDACSRSLTNRRGKGGHGQR